MKVARESESKLYYYTLSSEIYWAVQFALICIVLDSVRGFMLMFFGQYVTLLVHWLKKAIYMVDNIESQTHPHKNNQLILFPSRHFPLLL